jgi:hypothetical protein
MLLARATFTYDVVPASTTKVIIEIGCDIRNAV